MSGFTKWLFAGLGWAIAGPIGALLGYAARTHIPVLRMRTQTNNANLTACSASKVFIYFKKKGGGRNTAICSWRMPYIAVAHQNTPYTIYYILGVCCRGRCGAAAVSAAKTPCLHEARGNDTI